MVVALGLQQHGVVHLAHRLVKGEGGELQLGLPGVQPGQGEQILDDVGHPVRLGQDDPQEALLSVGGHPAGAVGQGLGVAADVGEGGAQLVGDVGHELPAQLLVPAQVGDVVDDHQSARLALLVKGGEQQLQIPPVHLPLPLQHVGPLQPQHLPQGGHVAEELLIPGVLPDGAAEHLLRRRVGLDDPAVVGEGHHTVGHVEEEGVQLVALVLHLLDGVLEPAGHLVEGVGEHADLVVRAHGQPPGEVAAGHLFRSGGELPDGGDHRPGQQEGEQHRDDQAKEEGLDDQAEHLAIEVVHRLPVVQDVDDIAVVPPLDGDGGIHIVGRDAALAADLAGAHGVDEVGLQVQTGSPLVVRAGQVVALHVQDVVVAAPAVHPQGAGVGVQDGLDVPGAVLLPLRLGLEVPHQGGLAAEGAVDLVIEALEVEARHRVDEKGPHHRHQRDDEQDHDQHQLHLQGAPAHGRTSFRGS